MYYGMHWTINIGRKYKKQFNEKFKLIAGNEYYEGNEKDILNTFNNLVMEYNNSYVINKKIDKIDKFNYVNSDKDEIDIDEIKEEFENYKEDIEFGGTKKLIKIHINQHHIGDNVERDDYIINFKYIYYKELEEYNLYIDAYKKFHKYQTLKCLR